MNTQDLKLLVTGASGFIGSRLALHLHRLGVDTVCTGRDANEVEAARVRELESAGVAIKLGDLRDQPFVRTIVSGRNAIIHLAAAQHESHMDDEHFKSVNVGATKLLLDASRELGVRRFVYGSTMGIYGSSGSGTLDEESADQPLNVYTRTKRSAEMVVHEYASELEVSIVRIAETYGPGDLRLLKLFKAIDKGRFIMIGSGGNRRQPIFVDDLIRGLVAAAHEPAAVNQTMLMTGNEPMTTREMVGYVADALEQPVPRLRIPLWPVLTVAAVVNAVLQPMHIKSPLHPRSLDFFRKSFVFSTSKAKTLLGVEPSTRFIEGARATLAWYRSQGYMPSRPTTISSSTAHV